MRYRSLEEMNKEALRKLFPPELMLPISRGDLKGGVACFAGEPAAAAAWRRDKEEGYGELLSFYVLPEARRLGIGSALLSAVIKEMGEDHRKGISFRYSEYADRTALTPFFNDRGYETVVQEMPLGRLTLGEIRDHFAGKGFDKLEKSGCCVYELPKKDRIAVREKLEQISGQPADEYDREWPGSYALYENGKLKAALFLREEREGVLSLDYLFSNGNAREMTGLLAGAAKRLLKHYPEDTGMEMLLSTDQGRKLYEGLFGKTKKGYRIASCRQSFAVV